MARERVRAASSEKQDVAAEKVEKKAAAIDEFLSDSDVAEKVIDTEDAKKDNALDSAMDSENEAEEMVLYEKLGGGILGLPGNVVITGVAGTQFEYPKNKIPLSMQDLVKQV